jgi:site-specific DNA-methyltransferase (adenine-specific)
VPGKRSASANLDGVIEGNALTVLKTLPSESIDMVMTSPPYWGLRDYGVEGQLGLEPDFRDFVHKLADIFDEVKRILKPEGTCWVNVGDTYLNDAPVRKGAGEQWNPETRNAGVLKRSAGGTRRSAARTAGVKQKSLCNIPARFAIEMTDRGWILRNEIVWHKPNGMPQSVKDRFSVDFEKLFFFTKSRRYYFEQQFEPLSYSSVSRLSQDVASQAGSRRALCGGYNTNGLTRSIGNRERGRNKRAVWTIATARYSGAHFAVYPEQLVEIPILAGCPIGGVILDPFFGSGTTGVVAARQDRHYIGIELNANYVEIAKGRLAKSKGKRRAG